MSNGYKLLYELVQGHFCWLSQKIESNWLSPKIEGQQRIGEAHLRVIAHAGNTAFEEMSRGEPLARLVSI